MSDDVYTQVNIDFDDGFDWAAVQPALREFLESQEVHLFDDIAEDLDIEALFDALRNGVDAFDGPEESDVGIDFITFDIWSGHRIDGLYGVAADLTKALGTGATYIISEEWKYEDPGTEVTTFQRGVRTGFVDRGIHNVLDFEGNVVPLNLARMVGLANSPSHLPSWMIRDAIRELLFRLGEDTSGIREN